MIKEEKENNNEQQKMLEENQQLKVQLSAFQDLHNLNQETYFRQQVLIQLEKIGLALQNLGEPEETPSKEEESK